jgi:hypothetical protein
MSGILENILSELQAIRLALATSPAASNGHIPAAQPQPVQPVAQPVAQPDPFAAAPQQPVQQAVTEADVMALINPHLANANVKAALQGVLAQLGIARLPDARPDQYAELYNRFNAVIQQASGAAAQAGVSII